jgi:hypothetical protein
MDEGMAHTPFQRFPFPTVEAGAVLSASEAEADWADEANSVSSSTVDFLLIYTAPFCNSEHGPKDRRRQGILEKKG